MKYDVKVPRNTYGNAPHAQAFWGFYDSPRESAELEYETEDKAVKCQKAICMLRDRHKIHDVTVTRRKNVLYLVRCTA